VLRQQLLDDLGPLASAGLRLPAVDGGVALHFAQSVQTFTEAVAISQEVAIVLQQELHAGGQGHLNFDAGCRPQLVHQHARHAQAANGAAFAFSKHRLTWAQLPQSLPDCGLEGFLAGLRLPGQRAQNRAAVDGQRFQVQHLRAFGRQGLK